MPSILKKLGVYLGVSVLFWGCGAEIVTVERKMAQEMDDIHRMALMREEIQKLPKISVIGSSRLWAHKQKKARSRKTAEVSVLEGQAKLPWYGHFPTCLDDTCSEVMVVSSQSVDVIRGSDGSFVRTVFRFDEPKAATQVIVSKGRWPLIGFQTDAYSLAVVDSKTGMWRAYAARMPFPSGRRAIRHKMAAIESFGVSQTKVVAVVRWDQQHSILVWERETQFPVFGFELPSLGDEPPEDVGWISVSRDMAAFGMKNGDVWIVKLEKSDARTVYFFPVRAGEDVGELSSLLVFQPTMGEDVFLVCGESNGRVTVHQGEVSGGFGLGFVLNSGWRNIASSASSLAMSDGAVLAAGFENGEVKVWDLEAEVMLDRYAQNDAVSFVSILGHTVLSESQKGGSVFVWRGEGEGQEGVPNPNPLVEVPSRVDAVAVSKGYVLTAENEAVWAWLVSTGELKRKFVWPGQERLYRLFEEPGVLVPDPDRVAFLGVGERGEVVLWSWPKDHVEAFESAPIYVTPRFTTEPTPMPLMTVGEDGLVVLYPSGTGYVYKLRNERPEDQAFAQPRFSLDGVEISSIASSEGWVVFGGRQKRSGEGRRSRRSQWDSSVWIWNVSRAEAKPVLLHRSSRDDRPTTVGISTARNLVVAGYASGAIQLWEFDPESGRRSRKRARRSGLFRRGNPVTFVFVSDTGSLFVGRSGGVFHVGYVTDHLRVNHVEQFRLPSERYWFDPGWAETELGPDGTIANTYHFVAATDLSFQAFAVNETIRAGRTTTRGRRVASQPSATRVVSLQNTGATSRGGQVQDVGLDRWATLKKTIEPIVGQRDTTRVQILGPP